MTDEAPRVFVEETDLASNRMQLPPHSEEAEAGVIGAVIDDPAGHLDRIVERGVTTKWFFSLRHQNIWDGIMALYGENRQIDMITVIDQLRSTGKVEDCGGIAYISSLPELSGGSESAVDDHVAILQDKWIARKTIEHCRQSIDKLMGGEDPTGVVSKLEVAMMGIGGESVSHPVLGMKQLAAAVSKNIEEQMKGKVTGVKTGFSSMDRIDRGIGGLSNEDMIVIAGRPSMGKTSLAMTIAQNVASQWKSEKTKQSVVVFSLEMSATQIATRMVAGACGDIMKRIGPNLPTEAQKQIIIGLGRTSQLDGYLIVDDTPGITISRLMAKARHYKRRNNVGLIVVDYLQLIASDSKASSREQEVSHISKAIKRLARELKIPVVALAQLNREGEKEKNRKPRLADLRESGQIEQDADVVGILYNPSTKEDEDDTNAPKQVNLRICKARNGRRDYDIPFMFVGSEFKFTDIINPRE